MASFTERIKIIVDVVTDSAQTAFGNFKSSVSEAEGTVGKFKAGATSVFDTVKANAGAFAVAGGAALVEFGVKAVGAFTDTAKAAIDLSTATGLSIEQASRWIAVGDDYEVSAEALQTGLGKISKTLDDTKWAKYGIATHDASGQARDANDILLDAFDTLSKITNETERARVGQELFGRGYQSLTPILGHTRAEYEKMLGAVEKGQVITKAEAEKAERFRLAEDELGDALKDVTLAVGEQVAGLAPLLVGLAKLVGLLAEIPGHLGKFGGAGEVIDTLYALRTEADKGGKSWEDYRGDVLAGRLTLDEAVEAIHKAAEAQGGLNIAMDGGEKSWENTTNAVFLSADAFAAAQKASEEHKKATEDLASAYDEVEARVRDEIQAVRDSVNQQLNALGTIGDFEQQVRDVASAYYGLQQQVIENDKTQKSTKATDDEKAQSQRDLDSTAHGAAEGILAMSASYATEEGAASDSKDAHDRQLDALILAKAQYPLLADEIQGYIDALNLIPSTVTTNLVLHTPFGGRADLSAGHGVPQGAEGGIVKARPGGTLVNVAEVGKDELLIPLDRAGVGVGGNTTIINHWPPGVSVQEYAKASRDYQRRGGR